MYNLATKFGSWAVAVQIPRTLQLRSAASAYDKPPSTLEVAAPAVVNWPAAPKQRLQPASSLGHGCGWTSELVVLKRALLQREQPMNDKVQIGQDDAKCMLMGDPGRRYSGRHEGSLLHVEEGRGWAGA